MSTTQPDWLNGQPKTLKALRMWHWYQLLANRKLQHRYELNLLGAADPDATRYRDTANLHLSAVQVLNDSLPGTAEQDCAAEDDHERCPYCKLELSHCCCEGAAHG